MLKQFIKRNAYVFIDASNLFYGGEKSLGWKIDYKKLKDYLLRKYNAEKIFYFGGVELHNFPFDYLQSENVSLADLESYLIDLIKNKGDKFNDADLLLISRHLKRVRFYLRLQSFGYLMHLKPVKLYNQDDGSTKKKANCDVEMVFYLMKEKDNFDQVIILSGDGDFLPILKYLKQSGKEVFILARGNRTAREIKQFAGGNFRDFMRLQKYIEFTK